MIDATYVKESQKSETLLMNEISKLKEDSGETIYKFGFGQSPFLPPQYIIDTLAEYAPRKEYAAVQGLEKLRESVAAFHNHYDGLNIQKENVLIGPGSKMLIYCVLASFTEADVLLIAPSWVSYEPQAKLARLNVCRIPTKFEDRWRLTPELMEEACQKRPNPEKPAVLILNYPGNPDGLSYSESELKALAEVFRKYNVLVISDEIYGLLNHKGEHLSLARYYPEGTIVTTGLSKWCGAGGWRLGVALLPSELDPKIQEAMIGIASETFSCAATPVQFASIQAYQADPRIDSYLKHQRRILHCAGMYVFSALKAAGLNVHEPEGGFYLNPDFTPITDRLKERGITTSEELTERLLEEASVAILPGSVFGHQPSELVTRLAYVDFNGVEALKASESISWDQPLDESFLKEYCPKIVEGTQQLVRWIGQ